MATFEDMFRKELDNFIREFRNRLAASKRTGANDEYWRVIRDELLVDYPKLRDCYSAHGCELALPIEKRSEKARLGRQFAGAMYSVRKDMYDVRPIVHRTVNVVNVSKEDTACGEPANRYRHISDEERSQKADEIVTYVAEAHKWLTKTPIMKSSPKTRQHISQHPMLIELTDVKPGEEISFIYDDKKLAREDQSKVAYFVKALGWYKSIQDGRRPYSTSITPHPHRVLNTWKLTIKRLDTSQPLPVVMQRG